MQTFDSDRYARQTRFAPLGTAGQARLAAGRVAVVGCGALGSVVAMALVRAGVGFLRIIDRDVPEVSNLPRPVCPRRQPQPLTSRRSTRRQCLSRSWPI